MRAQDFPIEFRREIEALLGGEADEFFAAYGRPHCRGLRLNEMCIRDRRIKSGYRPKPVSPEYIGIRERRPI